MRKMQVTSFANAMEYMKKKNGGAGGFEQFFTFQIYPLDRHGLRKQLRSWVQIPPGPFLSVVQLRYYFELMLGDCETKTLVTPVQYAVHRDAATHPPLPAC
jgi:hypothetical protein